MATLLGVTPRVQDHDLIATPIKMGLDQFQKCKIATVVIEGIDLFFEYEHSPEKGQ